MFQVPGRLNGTTVIPGGGRAVIRDKKVLHQGLGRIDAVAVEVSDTAFLVEERVVDQELAGQGARGRLGEDEMGGIGHDFGLAAHGDELSAEHIADGGGGDGGAGPQGVDGDAVLPELLGHAQDAQAHAVLGDGIGDMVLEPLRLQVERGDRTRTCGLSALRRWGRHVLVVRNVPRVLMACIRSKRFMSVASVPVGESAERRC